MEKVGTWEENPQNYLWTPGLILELCMHGSDPEQNSKDFENWTKAQTTIQVLDLSLGGTHIEQN